MGTLRSIHCQRLPCCPTSRESLPTQTATELTPFAQHTPWFILRRRLWREGCPSRLCRRSRRCITSYLATVLLACRAIGRGSHDYWQSGSGTSLCRRTRRAPIWLTPNAPGYHLVCTSPSTKSAKHGHPASAVGSGAGSGGVSGCDFDQAAGSGSVAVASVAAAVD